MAIDFSAGGSFAFTRPPRRIVVTDDRGGCPPSPANDRLMTATFTLANESIVSVQSQIIRRRSSAQRCDSVLYGVGVPNVNGSAAGTNPLMQYLSFNDQSTVEWDTHYHCWMGLVPVGTHTFYIDNVTTGCRNFYGCGVTFGQMHIMIFE
jgi:hypothetical protein